MWVPSDLGIKMGVQVNESRRDGVSVSVDFFDPVLLDRADSGDCVAFDGDITFEWLGAGAVDDDASAND